MSRFKQPPPHTSPPPSPLSPISPPPLSTLTSHFVQALHDYIPTNLSSQDAANCLCFSRGNIIEVLGRDDSGWWDGSCNGNRGWFPSNYVGMIGEVVRTETYSDEEEDAVEENSSSSSNSDSLCTSHLLVSWDNLINPIIQSASLLAASNDPSQFLSDVISAVRYLLACSGAMANDAPLLDSFPALAEQRRVVLSCLSHLVIQTRSHVDLAKSANELIEAVKDYAAVARESGMGNPTQNGGEFKIDDSNIAAALKVGTRERSIIDKLEGHRINVFSLLDNITAHGTITFEKRAEILEMTRKAVEAVRAYLSVLERDFGSDTSNIQEEPNMVSVILSKEAVYTAATNLVTAVRVASSLYGATMEEQKEDNEHVQTSIERVRVAILDSLRAMRFLSENSHDGSLNEPNARERLEMSASLRRAQTLSYLSRKATSLDVLKGQYLEDVERDRGHSPDSSLDVDDLQHVQAQLENHVTSEGRKSLDKAQALIQKPQAVSLDDDSVITNNEGQIMGGTLKALIERDMPLSETELELWTSRIQVPIRLRVYNVIKTWLEGFFSVEHDQNMRDALMEFAADDMAKVMPGPAKRMVELINRRFSFSSEGQLQQQQVLPSSITGSSLFNLTMFDDNNDSSLTAPPPPPIISKHLRQQLKKFSTDHDAWQQLNLLDIDPIELSRQMTLIENTLFCDIAPQEMLGQEFKKKVGVSSAIHVKAMIQLSTRVTGWIAESVLAEKEVKRRAAVIKYWIKVGDSCLQLQNYNTLMAIRSALDSTGVSRLRRTWDQLSSKHKNTLETMRSATDTSRNFAKYRQRLKGAIAPCLPFLGVYLTDMTFIDDGNSNVRTTSAGKELINFDKHIKATKVISEIQRFQLPYRLVPVEELQYVLHKNLDATDANDQELYTRSLRLEPREEDAETRSATSSERS
ncbi:ras guanine nucleotide exchange factor domain-containing protein [Umbelopsis sp. PMI_123]|nr:ras guanine nucleotide exchange factor domain-containing protein [Umbelopsis sp. PMI_123]